MFVLPTFTNTVISCPILSITILSSNVTAVATQSADTRFSAPPLNPSGYMSINPVNINIDFDYGFFIRVVAKGDFLFLSDEKKLYVGCTSTLTIIEN